MTNDTEHASAPVHPAETLKTEEELRHHIATAKRVVVKIGTSSLVNDDFSISQEQIDRIVDALQARMAAGSDVIVVSSGAIAAGMAPLGLSTRPRDLATKQASAAVGQVHLAQSWGRSFARYGRTIGQVLLTQSDAGRRDREDAASPGQRRGQPRAGLELPARHRGAAGRGVRHPPDGEGRTHQRPCPA